MKRQPTLSDRAMFIVARSHARRVYRQFTAATRKAADVQRRALLAKIRRNANSTFGQDHGFDHIRTIGDFRRQIPILTYEDHKPYIEQVQAGNLRAMFGPGQRVHMFALTSGTTDEPKYIPVTDAFIREYRAGWNAFGIKALLDHPEAFLRPILQTTSRMDESITRGGIPCGAITGLMANMQKRLVRKYYVAPSCIAEIDEPAAKYYTIMRLAVPSDVAFAITASPATQLKLARAADNHHEQLIRDVHDGTLWPDLRIAPHVRNTLCGMLRPDPAEARRLADLVSQHGRLLPKHYWQLAFLANWTGGTMGLHLQDFPEYFGDTPVRDVGLLASEGRISVPVEDHSPAGVLDVVNHFFEFVPADQIDHANPETLLCHQVTVGQEYFVLMTTSAGLYRYNIRDVVRVVGCEGQAPVVEFLNKGEHTCSLTGEKLTEHQVTKAMERVTQRTGMRVTSFVLAPHWDNPPYYRLHVEPLLDGSTTIDGQLGIELDGELCRANIEYAGRRSSDRLGPIQVNIVPDAYLTQLDHQQAERRRKGNEQFKHRYLYCQPGQDADVPVSCPHTSEI